MTPGVRRLARTVFLGSGSFAVPVLAVLAGHAAVDLVGVVTSPPRPAGRGGKMTSSPVGARASALALRVLMPERLRDIESQEAIEWLDPELLVLADYGQIVPRSLLEMPRHGALNLHPSLLPRHRGATPIPAAILAGDRRTGVSLMRMDEGLDTGPLIAVSEVPLQGVETSPELEAVLAGVAADLLAGTLPDWLAGRLPAEQQSGKGGSLTRPLRRADGRLDPRRPATELERQVRAYQPWPGSFLETDEERLIVWRSSVLKPPAEPVAWENGAATVAPGTLLEVDDGLALATVDGLLDLLEVQLAGGRRMGGSEIRRGRPGIAGSRVREVAVG